MLLSKWITCEHCGRRAYRQEGSTCSGPATFVYVRHAYYGCDTGCCGYEVVTGNDSDDEVEVEPFEFGHPWWDETDEQFNQLCEDLVSEHINKGLVFRTDLCERGRC